MSINGERVVAFIVVRLSSSRFQAKQLHKIGPRSILSWNLHHLKKAKRIDEIVLATVSEPENLPLKDFARDNSIDCFWYEGEVDHVTTRLYTAAKRYKADICILISGDCPLIDGNCIDELVIQLSKQPDKDYVSLPDFDDKKQCMLQGVSIARMKCWQKAEELSNLPELQEHQFPVIYQRPDIFSAASCHLPQDYYSVYHRLSVDTWADYRFFKEVYKELSVLEKDFSLNNTIELLEDNSQLRTINKHVHQRLVKEDIPQIFFVSFPAFSTTEETQIHRDFMISTGLQIIENKGWPIHYITNNLHLHDELAALGIRCTIIDHIHNIVDSKLEIPSSSYAIIDDTSSKITRRQLRNLHSLSSSLIIVEDVCSSGHNHKYSIRINLNRKWCQENSISSQIVSIIKKN